MDIRKQQAYNSARLLVSLVNDVLPQYMQAFRESKDVDFTALLNRITPTLISVRNDLDIFIQMTSIELEKV